MPDEGGVEGGEDLPHEGRMPCSCFFLRVSGGRHLSCRQRPDLVGREDGAQDLSGGGVCPVVGRDDLRLLPAFQVEPPCSRLLPGVLPSPLGPAPEAVEGVSGVPGAGPAAHDGCQGVCRLVRLQGARAVRQAHVPGDHAVGGLQVPTAYQRLWCDP